MDQFWNWMTGDNLRSGYKLFIGVYMALGCVYFASALLSRPFSRRKTLLIFVCASLFVWAWNFTSSITSLYMPGFYAAFILLLILVYKQKWRNAIFLALIHYFSVGLVPRLMWLVYRAVGGRVRIEAGVSYWDEPWIHIMTACAMLFILYFIRRQVRKIADYQLPPKEFFSMMILMLPMAFFSFGLTLLSAKYNVDIPLGIIVVWSVMSIGAILDLVVGRKQQQELAELRVMEDRLKEQYQRYQLKAESSERIMQKFHDLQKHLRLFQETRNQGYLEAYQAELKETIDAYDTVYETGNTTLDTVLSEAAHKCRAENISLICIADGNLIHFIEPIDICSMFGNALDNAIESAQKLTDPEKKIIHLKIYQENYLLLIKVENYYEHDMQYLDGYLATSKTDKGNHGYGVKSIRYVAEKYNGIVRITTEEGKFTLTVLINR